MEVNGYIEAITMFVAESVCKHIKYLHSSLGFSPKIAINVPPTLLCDKHFVTRLRKLFNSAACGVPPELIEIEITESTTAHDHTAVVNSASQLRSDGHDIALDDFGTGFSGLRNLDLIPASIIKIDRHFVNGLGERKTCDMIVASVARMARDSSMIAVAEGIETHAQLEHVTSLGYHEAQGFLLGKPMPPKAFFSFLAARPQDPQKTQMAQPRILSPAGCQSPRL